VRGKRTIGRKHPITTGETGWRAALAELLALAARHASSPEIEGAAMQDSQLQIDRLRQNEVRYRAVLENR
jgi:D-arabinose 1-dehydrogenase-like Zn-dependent alcohol dehydrogenase